MQLALLLQQIKDSAAFQRKTDLQQLTHLLKYSLAEKDYPYGDEAAVISTLEGYDLLAASAPETDLLKSDPWFAGWLSIAKNCLSIAAMGGHPVAAINTLWGQHDEQTRKLLQGISHAAQVYQVPIMGGHAELQSNAHRLSVSVLGRAKHLLSSYNAAPGQQLVVAIDTQGQYRDSGLYWHATTHAKTGNTRKQLDLISQLLDDGLLQAGRHIGDGGILASCLSLLEGSHVGGELRVDDLPKPEQVSWQSWLRSQPSYGFILSVAPEHSSQVIERFAQWQVAAQVVGEITAERTFYVSHEQEREVFWDLSAQPFTGLNHPEYKLLQPPNQLQGVSQAVDRTVNSRCLWPG